MAAHHGTYTYSKLIVVLAEQKLTTYVYAVACGANCENNISVRTVARSHGVVGAASPVQLKPWTKPDLVQVGGVVLTGFAKSEFDASTDRNTVMHPGDYRAGNGRCFLCGKEGHYARNCNLNPQSPQNQQRGQGSQLHAAQMKLEGPVISQGRLGSRGITNSASKGLKILCPDCCPVLVRTGSFLLLVVLT
ncbi:hypothetical protein TIFTF001_035859 [Ficus carica]|uniref:CCHC-type domain-containing protein n=1 Tax=Ficus carica TaxID=3494 RepID=A0AA88J6Z1_FICCA|nr:hypothetical protein TIFTF001_035859 [Ficus carica]